METLGGKNTDLTELKMCRICQRKTEQPLNHELQAILMTCFESSAEDVLKYPKFTCGACRDFLKKCQEFAQLCTKTKLNMLEYTKTRTWPNPPTLPSWLTSAPKRQSQQEDAIPVKKVRDETIVSGERCDQEKSKIGQVPVSTSGFLTGPSSERQVQLGAEKVISTTRAETQHRQDQSAQQSHPIIQQPYSQLEPSPAQATQTSLPTCRMQNLHAPSYQTQLEQQQQQQQQQQPQSPSQSDFFYHLQRVIGIFDAARRSKRPVVAPNTHAGRPIQPTPSRRLFQCTVCLLVLPSRKLLVLHASKHKDWKEFICCDKLFLDCELSIRHLRQHYKSKACSMCQTPYENQGFMYGHLEAHERARLSHCCEFCLLVFVDRDSRAVHLRNAHREEVQQLIKLNPNVIVL